MKLNRLLFLLILLFPITINAETINVSSFEELKTAITNGNNDISITENMEVILKYLKMYQKKKDIYF